MKLILPIALAAFLAFVLGWLASRSFHVRLLPADVRPAELASAPEPTNEKTLSAIDPPTRPVDTDAPPSRVPEARTNEGLISEALRKYALAELAAGWHETRKDPLPEALLASGYTEFEQAVLALPRNIGRRLAKKQGQIEAIAGNDPFAVVQALQEGNFGPQLELIRDEARMASFFVCESGPRVDGRELIKGGNALELQPGTVIEFPAGVYDLGPLTNRLRTIPHCLTIVGAGMDRTLLRFRGLTPSGKLDRFEVRDCTIESQCEAINLRAAGVWRALRVRFVGFDCGAGGSSALTFTHGGVVLELISCRIEGGFGRSPSNGKLFGGSGAFLGRFEDCTISTLDSSLRGLWTNSTLLLRRCRFENLLDRYPFVDSDKDGVMIEETTFQFRAKDAGNLPKRDLAELFPAWIQPTKR